MFEEGGRKARENYLGRERNKIFLLSEYDIGRNQRRKLLFVVYKYGKVTLPTDVDLKIE